MVPCRTASTLSFASPGMQATLPYVRHIGAGPWTRIRTRGGVLICSARWSKLSRPSQTLGVGASMMRHCGLQEAATASRALPLVIPTVLASARRQQLTGPHRRLAGLTPTRRQDVEGHRTLVRLLATPVLSTYPRRWSSSCPHLKRRAGSKWPTCHCGPWRRFFTSAGRSGRNPGGARRRAVAVRSRRQGQLCHSATAMLPVPTQRAMPSTGWKGRECWPSATTSTLTPPANPRQRQRQLPEHPRQQQRRQEQQLVLPGALHLQFPGQGASTKPHEITTTRPVSAGAP